MKPIKAVLPPELSGTTQTSPLSKSSTEKIERPSPDWKPSLIAYEPSLVKAAELCEGFALNVAVNRSPYWLTFSGVTGCGKTMLAEQTFKEARKWNPANLGPWETGVGVYNPKKRRPESRWFDAVTFADRVFQERDFVLDLAIDFLVVIDDIGTANDPTKRVAEALYRLANLRLGKWTIWTTNLSRAEIGRNLDERLASRMFRDGNVFHRINAGDYSLRPKT